jgi:hypothetical protein
MGYATAFAIIVVVAATALLVYSANFLKRDNDNG